MRNSTTLFMMNRDTPSETIADLAEASAQTRTHLSCLILGSRPELPAYIYGMPPYGALSVPDNWGELIKTAHQNQKKKVEEVEKILARSNVSGDVQSAFCVPSETRHRVARWARVCDIAYIAPNLREMPYDQTEAAHGVLFHSPVGLMLNGLPSSQAKQIFIAWDGSKAASRSVHVALPYLKEANEVIVGCFDPVTTAAADGADPGTELAAWLSHHGCNVTLSQYPSGGQEIAQCIQDRAKETGADLVVMGAYGHARMLQAVFGGTTRTMMEQIDLPVLLAH